MAGLAGRHFGHRPRALGPLALAASLALVSSGCDAQPVPESPPTAQPLARPAPALALTGRVVDTADILLPADEAALISKLATLEAESGPQFVVVSTKSLNGQPIERYSLNLANAWALGDKGRDDGVMLLVAPTERKVRIEVGYGLEMTLSDELCAAIIAEKIVPRYKAGDLAGGTLAGADALIAVLRAHPTLPAARPAT
jgi:uncharacterized protein